MCVSESESESESDFSYFFIVCVELPYINKSQ